jgi:hypothetical protein
VPVEINFDFQPPTAELSRAQWVLVGNYTAGRVQAESLGGTGYRGAFPRYSTRPFAMPDWGSPQPKGGRVIWFVPKNRARWGKLVGRKNAQGRPKAYRFRFYPGGYAEYRRAMGRQVNPPNLSFTGRMMQDFQTVQTADDGVTVGFVNPASREKAARVQARGFHFVGLSAANRDRVGVLVGSLLGKTLTAGPG